MRKATWKIPNFTAFICRFHGIRVETLKIRTLPNKSAERIHCLPYIHPYFRTINGFQKRTNQIAIQYVPANVLVIK